MFVSDLYAHVCASIVFDNQFLTVISCSQDLEGTSGAELNLQIRLNRQIQETF